VEHNNGTTTTITTKVGRDEVESFTRKRAWTILILQIKHYSRNQAKAK